MGTSVLVMIEGELVTTSGPRFTVAKLLGMLSETSSRSAIEDSP